MASKQSKDDDERYETEEFYVYVDLDTKLLDEQLSKSNTKIKFLGIDTQNPIMQLNNQLFKGKYLTFWRWIWFAEMCIHRFMSCLLAKWVSYGRDGENITRCLYIVQHALESGFVLRISLRYFTDDQPCRTDLVGTMPIVIKPERFYSILLIPFQSPQVTLTIPWERIAFLQKAKSTTTAKTHVSMKCQNKCTNTMQKQTKC